MQLFARVDIGEGLRLVVEADFHDVESRVPRIDLAAAVSQKVGEVIEHAAAHERKYRVRLVARFRNGEFCAGFVDRSEEHTSELQSRLHLVCRLLLEKKKKKER